MTERWRTMVEKYVQNSTGFCRIIDPMDAVKLLARQHRAFVRMVRKYRDADKLDHCRKKACDDILAALANEKGGKK